MVRQRRHRFGLHAPIIGRLIGRYSATDSALHRFRAPAPTDTAPRVQITRVFPENISRLMALPRRAPADRQLTLSDLSSSLPSFHADVDTSAPTPTGFIFRFGYTVRSLFRFFFFFFRLFVAFAYSVRRMNIARRKDRIFQRKTWNTLSPPPLPVSARGIKHVSTRVA